MRQEMKDDLIKMKRALSSAIKTKRTKFGEGNGLYDDLRAESQTIERDETNTIISSSGAGKSQRVYFYP